MLNRRRFLSAGAIGAGVLLPAGLGPFSRRAFAQAAKPRPPKPILGSTLTKYVDLLPIPNALTPSGLNTYDVGMTEHRVKVHRDLPPTTVWSYYDKTVGAPYTNTYLGPTIVTTMGTPISVTWHNELPSRFLPTLDSKAYSVVDWTLMGGNTQGPGAAVVHVHGGAQPPQDDGLPWDWFAPGHHKTTIYPNSAPGSLIWYHDHAMGMTRLNVFAGLAGAYLIVDPDPRMEPKMLPTGPYDVPLVIQDRIFDTKGQFYYPINPLQGFVPEGYHTTPWPGPSVPEFFGDTILVNGKVWPYLNVEARLYRFRIINGSQARFYNLSFTGTDVPSIDQIGAEGGYLTEPATLTSLLIAPGERADLLVDFTDLDDRSFILSNDANAPYSGGDPVDLNTTAQVMQFRVVPVTSKDKAKIPHKLPGPDLQGIPPPPKHPPITEVVLFEQLVGGTSVRLQLGPGGALEGRSGGVPFDATVPPPHGTGTPLPIPRGWNVIRFINTTGDVHPMHTHLFMYQVLKRQAFDTTPYLKPPGTDLPDSVTLLGSPTGPNPNETGLKDTVMVNPGEICDVLAYVDPTAVGLTYVMHCHILEHEEKDMMLAFRVV